MKKNLMLIAAAIIIALSSCQQKEKTSKEQNDIVGAYQYTGNIDGMTIWTEKYFVAAGKRKNGSSTIDSANFYKNAYQSLLMEGGTWTKEDSIVTCTYLFAKNPSLVGESFRFTYSIKGDSVVYYVLNENNERIGGGSNIKLKQSNINSDPIGVYKYTGPREGMSVQFDDYFIYILRFKHEPSTPGTEDYYEKEYKSLVIEAGRWTKNDSIVSNYMLYNKNGKLPSSDEPSFRWIYSYKGDSIAVNILNKEGKVRGEPMYGLRLE